MLNALRRGSVFALLLFMVAGPSWGAGEADASSPGPDAPENYALQFEGDDHVTMGTMDLSGSALTMEVWVKPSRFPNTLHTIAGIERSGEAAALLRVGDVGLAPDKPQFVLRIGGKQVKLNAQSRLDSGRWQHLVVTYDGQHMRLYINGELDAERRQSGRVSAQGVFRVSKSFGGRYFYGEIDELRVWDKALSKEAVEKFGGSQIIGGSSSSRIVGYWPFNEGRGSVVEDEAPERGQQTGTIQGATWTSPGAPSDPDDVSESDNQESTTLNPSAAADAMRREAARSASQEDDNVEIAGGFTLDLSDVRLRYEAASGMEVRVHGAALETDRNWELRKVRKYLYHIRRPGWRQGIYWSVNTVRKTVRKALGGQFGEAAVRGTRYESLNVSVTPFGNPRRPGGFDLHFPSVTFQYDWGGENVLLFSFQDPSGDKIWMGDARMWDVERMGNTSFHARHRSWDGFFWEVDTDERALYKVERGRFGQMGGKIDKLEAGVDAIPR